MTAPELRIAICARVSDKDKQGDNTSAPDQLDRMRAYCIAEGWNVSAEFTEQDSAFIDGLNRPQLNKMLTLAREKQIDALMFYRSDRFTRDSGDGVVLRRQIKKYGARLFFYSPYPREITSDQELINILEDYISQRDAEKRREDSMRGYNSTVELNVFSQGTAPYGYQLIGRKKEKQLEIVPELAKIVETIFNWYVVEGIGTVAIAQRLTDMRVTTPGEAINRNRIRGNGEWYQSTVYDILRDESYAGVWYAFRWKRIAGTKKSVRRPKEEWKPITIPAIVDRSIWQRAQQRLDNRGDHCRNVKHHYLMARRLKCTCDYACQGKYRASRKPDGEPTLYYRCSSQLGKLARGKCDSPFFRAEDVDATVWEFVEDLLLDPERILRDYSEAQKQQSAAQNAIKEQISIIDEQVTSYNAEIDNLLDARKNVNSDMLKRKYDAQADELAELIDRLVVKRVELIEKLGDTTLTDDHITSAIDELKAGAELVKKARNNPAAQRKLVEFLNLRAVLRVTDGVKWVDIKWLYKSYPLPVRNSKQDNSSALSCLVTHIELVFPRKLRTRY